MGVSVNYVRQPKTGRLDYRLPFPKEIRAYTGRSELIVSLQARALSEPGALDRYRAANDEYKAKVPCARRARGGR